MRNRSKINTHERFIAEYESLLGKINQNIMDLAQYQRVELEKPKIALTEELNQLKLYRKKLQDMLDRYRDSSEQEWQLVREKAQETYSEAEAVWQKTSDELAPS